MVESTKVAPLDQQVLAELRAIVGERNVITDLEKQWPFLQQPSRYSIAAKSRAVVRPKSTAEVCSIVRLASDSSIPLVPQGGNTGLVGGQIPVSGEIVLSLQAMDRIREVDTAANVITCEAGVILRNARQAAASANRMLPLLLPSDGSCTIGGNVATNAGGTQALSYGITRDQVVGLEVVLANGEVLSLMRKLKKDNTGYNLHNLFIGSEGTLGIITAAMLKLVPERPTVETGLAGLNSVENALVLLAKAYEIAAGELTSFELLSGEGLACVVNNMPSCRFPTPSKHRWYVFIELSSATDKELRRKLEELLFTAVDQAVVEDGIIATSLDQAQALWNLREVAGEAQRREGDVVGHDISVPAGQVAAFLIEADAAVQRVCRDCRPMPFGHLGDGNIHYTVVQPRDMPRGLFSSMSDEINGAVHRVVSDHLGSISAEHGIGLFKREALSQTRDAASLNIMRGIKQLLDPKGIMNPGKVLMPHP